MSSPPPRGEDQPDPDPALPDPALPERDREIGAIGDPSRQLAPMLYRALGDLTAQRERLVELENRVEDLAGAVDAVEAGLATAAAAASAPAGDQDAAPSAPASHDAPAGDAPGDGAGRGLDMRRLVAWVGDNVAYLIERKTPQTSGAPYWCRSWWCHPEAIARLEAMRRCWVDAVSAQEGSAMAVYFEHLDHHLGVLCGESGPFSACTGGSHRVPARPMVLGQDDPPEAYFAEFDAATLPHPRDPQAHDPRPHDARPRPVGRSAASPPDR